MGQNEGRVPAQDMGRQKAGVQAGRVDPLRGQIGRPLVHGMAQGARGKAAFCRRHAISARREAWSSLINASINLCRVRLMRWSVTRPWGKL